MQKENLENSQGDGKMINENSELRKLDLQSLLKATKSKLEQKSDTTAKLFNDTDNEFPDWDCQNGVCVLEWKPRRPKKS